LIEIEIMISKDELWFKPLNSTC